MEGSHTNNTSNTKTLAMQQRWRRLVDLAVCVSGIYVTYMVYAALQEKITCTPYGEKEERFNDFNDMIFLMLVQCIANSIAAYLFIATQRQPVSTVVWHRYAISSFTYLGGMLSSYIALNFINFPTMVLTKSCKMIPVMIMGLFFRQRYSTRRWISMILVAAGISSFMLLNKSSSSNQGSNSLFGLALVMMSLTFDGLTGASQDALLNKHKDKLTTHRLMFEINRWAVVELAVVLAVVTAASAMGLMGSRPHPLVFVSLHPTLLLDIALFCVVSAVGQNFVFYSIRTFGSLTCSVITTTRKFFSILYSVIVYGHVLLPAQWVAVVVVFIGLSGEFFKDKPKDKPL